MISDPLQADAAPEPVLHAWQTPLSPDQRHALHALHQRELAAWKSLDKDDQAQADPAKAVLVESARQWLDALHTTWECSSIQSRKAAKEFDAQVQKLIGTEVHFHALSVALQAHCRQAFLQLLWEHGRTKALVRSGASQKAFLQSEALQDVDVFDVPAVLRELTQAGANPDALAAQRQAITAALRSLGHFTSKPTHTAAQPVGIVVKPSARSVGPYLTAGLVVERGRPLWLDQAVNDNTGRTSFCLDVLNGGGEQADAATAALVREVAAELFAGGYEHGTQTIDPRLRQILLPAADGRYRAVTPLTSMGLSAYLHSYWQSRQPGDDGVSQSFGKPVFYGFSATAINNFTAIRKVSHALDPDRKLSGLPNRALVFEVPRLDEAHATLARIRHRGYRPRLSKELKVELFGRYMRNASVLQVDSMRAMATESRMYRQVLRFVWHDLLALHAQCADALEDLDEATRAEILASSPGQTVIEQFLLVGMAGESDQGVSPRALAKYLAAALFRQVEQLKDESGKTLGLSQLDRQRFMRWAPTAIARTFSER